VSAPPLDPWEAAYLRFETPAQEIRKFEQRLLRLGAREWPRDLHVVELFCGRGNGLRALERLGFRHVEGVDRSAALLARYQGPARLVEADCRALPFESASRDLIVIHGGLHHLPQLHEDLARTLDEARRVLRATGRIALVEPWETPFLRFVHAVSLRPWIARCWDKLDAFATMTRYEAETYFAWLAAPEPIRAALAERFEPLVCDVRWGKLHFLGRRRS
jgi:SAM-dependent methyltransferase